MDGEVGVGKVEDSGKEATSDSATTIKPKSWLLTIAHPKRLYSIMYTAHNKTVVERSV